MFFTVQNSSQKNFFLKALQNSSILKTFLVWEQKIFFPIKTFLEGIIRVKIYPDPQRLCLWATERCKILQTKKISFKVQDRKNMTRKVHDLYVVIFFLSCILHERDFFFHLQGKLYIPNLESSKIENERWPGLITLRQEAPFHCIPKVS